MIEKKVKIGLGSFDFAKGIAVISVILFHMRNRYIPANANECIPIFPFLLVLGSGLIPMFFIISGYGFKPKKEKVLLKKTFFSMIVPYLVGIPIIVASFIAFSYPAFANTEELLKRFWGLLTGLVLGLPENRMVGNFEIWAIVTMWFFWALFLAQNLLNLIVKVKKLWAQVFFVVLTVLAGFALRAVEFDLYCIPQGLMAVGFCYVGYIIKKWNKIEHWLYSPWVYICLSVLCIPQFFTGYFNMASGEYGLLSYFSACCGGMLMLLVALWCNRFEGWLTTGIRKLGSHSLWIIYTHGVERLAFPWDQMAAESSNLFLTFLIEVGLKVVIIILGCMIFKKIAKIKYRLQIKRKIVVA